MRVLDDNDEPPALVAGQNRRNLGRRIEADDLRGRSPRPKRRSEKKMPRFRAKPTMPTGGSTRNKPTFPSVMNWRSSGICLADQYCSLRSIFSNHRLKPIPIHQWQVLILRVFSVSE